MIDTIRNWFTPTPTEPLAPEDRRALVEQRAATAAEHVIRAAQLQAADEQAQARVGALERELDHARRVAATAQLERLAASLAFDRHDARLAARLRAEAPPEIQRLRDDLALLVEAVRLKAETRSSDGFEDATGRRPGQASTNAAEVRAVIEAVGKLDKQLAALLEAEAPDLAPFGPCSEIRLTSRMVRVPTVLAEALHAADGVPSLAMEVSPAEARQREWAREEAAKRRYPEPGSPQWRPWR